MLKLLVVDQSFQGDVLMSSAAYREILIHFPQAKLLTLPVSEEVAAHCGFFGIYTSWMAIKRGEFDIAIHLHTSLKTNLILWWKRIPVRIGYAYKYNGLPLTVRVPLPHRTIRKGYRVDEVCDLVEKVFGWRITNRSMAWNPSCKIT